MTDGFSTSDDFDFDFNDSGNPPERQQETATETPPQGPTLEEFQTLKQELEAQKAWKEQAARFFGGDPTAGNSQEQTAQFLQQFATNPNETLAQVVQRQIAEQLATQAAAQQLRQEYSQKYPHLVPFADEIFQTAQQVYQNAMATGKSVSDRQALDEAAKAWEQKVNQFVQARQQTGFTQQNALPYTIPTQGQTPGAKLNFDQMSDADFAKVMAARERSRS